MREFRSLLRTRKQLTCDQTRHVQRIQKTLEEANIKPDSVPGVSDLADHSGQNRGRYESSAARRCPRGPECRRISPRDYIHTRHAGGSTLFARVKIVAGFRWERRRVREQGGRRLCAEAMHPRR
jgi:hypothetical protein